MSCVGWRLGFVSARARAPKDPAFPLGDLRQVSSHER